MKTIVMVLLLALSGLVQAQSTPAKKELVARMLKLQQPAIEGIARGMAESPAAQIAQQLGPAMQRVPPEKREAVAKSIEAELKRYADEAGAIARERALKIAPTTVGAVLEEKFSEKELQQIVTWLESPLARKYQQLGPDMQKALGEKLGGELRGPLEPKVKALEQAIVKHLGLSPPAAASADPGDKPPAKPAAK